MRAWYTALIRYGGREALLSIPSTREELDEVILALDCTPERDIEIGGAYTITYRSRMGGAPEENTSFVEIHKVAVFLSEMTRVQRCAMAELCRVFHLSFRDVQRLAGWECHTGKQSKTHS